MTGRERFAQPGPGAGGAGEAVVDVDAFGRDAEPGERFTLGGEVLLVGGDPRVADEEVARERRSVPYRPPSPGRFSGGSYGTPDHHGRTEVPDRLGVSRNPNPKRIMALLADAMRAARRLISAMCGAAPAGDRRCGYRAADEHRVGA